MSLPGAGPDAAEPWHRLDPRMLLIHPIREVGRLLPALLAAVFAGRNAGGGFQWIWPVVGTVIVVGFGIARWFTTSYRFTSTQVQLRHGVIQRNLLAASTDKVRTVEVSASLLHRALGLAAVEIGTGAGDKPVKLDGLPAGEAAALRADLLQHKSADVLEADVEGQHQPSDDVPAWVIRMQQDQDQDTVLYRLKPAWLLFAPLGPTGFITAAIVVGFGFQVTNELQLWDSWSSLHGFWTNAQDLGVIAAVALAGLAIIAFVSVLAIAGFAVNYFGFTLGRDAQGRTLHVQRGLLTTRSTSLEVRRLRGIAIRRPLPLRPFGGARLMAVMTGLDHKHERQQAGAVLTPASPLDEVRRVGDAVLNASVSDRPLQRHGSAATRRRYTRALLPALVLASVAVAVSYGAGRPVLGASLAVVLLVIGVLLGRSRAHYLGHALTDEHLITRSGCANLSTVVLERDSTVAVTVRRTFFQRRAGVATVEVATAAGDQGYRVIDVEPQQAEKLAAAMLQR